MPYPKRTIEAWCSFLLKRAMTPNEFVTQDAKHTVTPAFVATRCAFPRKDGQAELIWVVSGLGQNPGVATAP